MQRWGRERGDEGAAGHLEMGGKYSISTAVLVLFGVCICQHLSHYLLKMSAAYCMSCVSL